MQLRLFLTKFHSGTVNMIVHVVGFAILFYGASKGDYLLASLGFVVQEMGHVYNHFFVFKGKDKELFFSMIPLQIFFGGLFLILLYLIYAR